MIPVVEQKWYYLTHSWEDKGVHAFPKGIGPKVNALARLEFELTYHDVAVQNVCHPPPPHRKIAEIARLLKRGRLLGLKSGLLLQGSSPLSVNILIKFLRPSASCEKVIVIPIYTLQNIFKQSIIWKIVLILFLMLI